MKTRLLKKFRKIVKTTSLEINWFSPIKFKHSYSDIFYYSSVGRNFRYKYRRYSRKYWTAEARMARMLRGEKD